MQCNN